MKPAAASDILVIRHYRSETTTETGVFVFDGFALMNGIDAQSVIEIFDTQAAALQAARVLIDTPMPAWLRI